MDTDTRGQCVIYVLKANKHYDGYDVQKEIGSYPTREAAEMAAGQLMDTSYIHDECEIRRPTYVVVEDRTNEPERTVEAVAGDRTAAKPTRTKADTNRSAKRKDHHVAD